MFLDQEIYAALAFAVNALIMFLGYSFILTPRFPRYVVVLLPTVCVAVGGLLISSLIYEPAVRGTVMMPLLVLCVFVLFRDPVRVKISALLLMEAIEVFADMATWPLAALTVHVDDKAQISAMVRTPEAFYVRLYYWLIAGGITLVLVILWKKYVRPRHLRAEHPLILTAAIFVFAQVLFMEQISEAISAERISTVDTWVLVGMDFLGSTILCIAFSLFRDDTAVAFTSDTLHRRKKMQEQYMEEIAVYAASIREMRDQMYGSVEMLSMLLDYGTDDDVRRVLESLGKQVPGLGPGIYSDSLAVNSIISDKEAAARRQGIVLECPASIDLAPPLSEFDACTILSNVLDNAIAAVSDLPKERWIRLTLQRRAGLLIFECINPRVRGRRRRSRGREHGLGLNIVKDVVRRSGGTFHAEKGEKFRVVISLPCAARDAQAAA